MLGYIFARKNFVALIVLALSTGIVAAPVDKSSVLINFANDYANVLTPAELRGLEQQLVDISHGGRYQIAAALHRNLPEGATPEDTTELADKLMVGTSMGDRGIVVLGFLDRKLVRVEVGYGLEGLLPDVIARRAAGLAAARFARGEYAAGLKDAIALLEKGADETTRNTQPEKRSLEWLPDIVLAAIDATRGVAFFATHRHELPKQLAIWWKAQDAENRLVLSVAMAGGALFVLACLRPFLGALLCFFLPLSWVRTSATRWLFFRFTDASFEKDWKKAGGPPAVNAPREYYVFELLYYGFAAFATIGLVMGAFVTFMGHPGGFGGAGASARW